LINKIIGITKISNIKIIIIMVDSQRYFTRFSIINSKGHVATTIIPAQIKPTIKGVSIQKLAIIKKEIKRTVNKTLGISVWICGFSMVLNPYTNKNARSR
ncbi:hypothetical protein ABN128_28785, partial [Klebsiella variicola subsp. variicola]